jgi:hypothetical protein
VFERIRSARRALVVGMGGGGDVVGALAVAALCESLGTETRLGGVAWERLVIDPYPGPRSPDQVRGGRRLDGVILADAETTTPEGVPFAEARMAARRSEPVALLDVTRGPGGVATGLQAAAAELGCDLAILVDVGGDVLARGDEPGLASPLCDAVMLSALDRLEGGLEPLFGVVGPGCDGELTAAEVIRRVADLAAAGAWLGTFSVDPAVAAEIEEAAATIPTEASLQIARCARGEVGPTTIRAGRRPLELSPLGALGFVFDPARAFASGALPLANAVADADSIDAARDRLAALGIRTELDYERERVGPDA